MTGPNRDGSTSGVVVALALLLVHPVAVQRLGPTIRGVLNGYGAAGYPAVLADDFDNGFTGPLAPVTPLPDRR